eukprot:scaffold13299_cov71-Cylindrotheca_fusiformis.AAC.3
MREAWCLPLLSDMTTNLTTPAIQVAGHKLVCDDYPCPPFVLEIGGPTSLSLPVGSLSLFGVFD